MDSRNRFHPGSCVSKLTRSGGPLRLSAVFTCSPATRAYKQFVATTTETRSEIGDEADLHVVPSMWPPLIGLAVVVVLSLATIGIDVVIDEHTANETGDLVDNSLRSVAIADDLRVQVHRLARPNLGDGRLASIAAQIAKDAHLY